eukprot:364180-Chlamydomonas_euryale.AAC.11
MLDGCMFFFKFGTCTLVCPSSKLSSSCITVTETLPVPSSTSTGMLSGAQTSSGGRRLGPLASGPPVRVPGHVRKWRLRPPCCCWLHLHEARCGRLF